MTMTGHKTRSASYRDNIFSEAHFTRSTARLAAHVVAQPAS
jgi:hypothetical protein